MCHILGQYIGTNDCTMDCSFLHNIFHEGNGSCESQFNCAEFNYDGGECSINYSNNGSSNKAKNYNVNRFNNRGLFKNIRGIKF